MKSKTTTGLLALFLGGLGFHRFYLGQTLLGLVYLFFCWTFIPAVIAFFEALYFLFMSDEKFNLKYNGGMQPALVQAQPQNIVVNVPNSASTGSDSLSSKLRELKDLAADGLISEDEFEEKKKVLLSGD